LAPSNKKSVIRVLHVDDELCLLEVSKQILTMENNFEIDNALSVDEALKKMGEQQYDAIVSDYEMPQKNGLEFLKELREQKNQIPFILFTGKGREDVAVKALNLGADNYINKNGSPETVYCELAYAINKTVERKKIEEKLQAASLYSRSLLEASLDPLVTISKEGKITDVIKATEDVTGCSREELIGSDFSEYFTEPEQARTGYHEVFTEGFVKDYLLTIRHKFGRITNVLYNASIYRNSQGEIQGVFAAARDMTERKKAEEALRNTERLLSSVTNGSSDAIYVKDNQSHWLFANPALEQITGKPSLELLGKTDAEIYANPKIGKAIIENDQRIMKTGKAETVEETVDSLGGPRSFISVKAPRFDAQGQVIGIVGISHDITERKRNEEKLKESIHKNELINEKLSVVGSLTRHDVGNKLMVMKSNIYLLKKQIGDNHKLAKYLEGIDSAIKQSDEMFEFSRSYEKIGVEKPSKTDVAQCFNQAAMLLPSFGTIKILNDCHGLEVMADSLLKQLFYNFLDNSLKHGEKVTLIRLHFIKEGSGVKLFYEDNGVGIPEANKPKLFHEGFSTGRSTGLGLFLIKKMVEVYGWTINEEGEFGKGAKFVITIPTSVFESLHALENQSAN